MVSLSFKIFILIFIILATFYPRSATAAGSCTATVTPSSVMTSTDTNFAFSITNNGSQGVTYVKITRPSVNFSLENYGVSGWNVNANNTFAELTGGTVTAGATLNFNYHGTSGSSEAASADWTVQTNDGTGVVNCTGSLGTAISGVADVTPPVLSEVTISSITSTSANLSWTTDENADSVVDYGLTSDYGSTASDATQTTTHSLTISGLTANTTYYYQVKSADASGNTGYGDYNNFTTAVAGVSTATPTPTATSTTTTTTTTVSATATPTPRDATAPRVTITTEIEETYEEAPLIEGEATDNRSLATLEYSTDGGENWLPVDQEEFDGDRAATFSFTPRIVEDGNYTILARATDDEGNSGNSEEIVVIIDRLPPRVGANLVSLGPLPLYPNADGSIITIPGLEQRITLSSVGGATSIDLFINNSMSSLAFSSQIGLWNGALNLNQPGRYKMRTRAVDGAGNITERDLNDVVVATPGSVFETDSDNKKEKGVVTVYVQDPMTRFWSKWDANTFGQENPQNLIDGTYSFFLPPGTYYATITETGEPKLTTKIFKIDTAQPFVSDFKLKKRKVWSLGPISIPLPDLFSDKADVVFKSYANVETTDTLVGKQLPRFSLPGTGEGLSSADIVGARSVITFVNTWSPPSVEQLPILDKYFDENSVNHAIIVSEETIPKVTIFRRRGNYTSELLVDRDGELVEDFHLTSLPKHLFIDRRGVVTKVVTGVLNAEELKSHLSDI